MGAHGKLPRCCGLDTSLAELPVWLRHPAFCSEDSLQLTQLDGAGRGSLRTRFGSGDLLVNFELAEVFRHPGGKGCVPLLWKYR